MSTLRHLILLLFEICCAHDCVLAEVIVEVLAIL